MKFVLATDHHQYLAWLNQSGLKDQIDGRHVHSSTLLYGLRLDAEHQLVELANWQDNKSLEFVNAVNRLKHMKRL